MIRKTCQLCHGTNIVQVIDLGYHPLADRFLKTLDEPELRWPLIVDYCASCRHMQNRFVISKEERYFNYEYSYDSGNSPLAVAHFSELALEIKLLTNIGHADLAIDIGCSVGTLLRSLREKTGCSILGIEPSNLAAQCEFSMQCFWEDANIENDSAHVIVATNVFNHSGEPHQFIEKAFRVLKRSGWLILEVPYAVELLHARAFDTIYHEHAFYFLWSAFDPFFADLGFYLWQTRITDYMGGSIRLYLRKSKPPFVSPSTHLASIELHVKEAEMIELSSYASRYRSSLCQRIYKVLANGGRIGAVGAAAKGNTLLNFCHIGRHMIECVADTSPYKIGKYTPGSHIPITPESSLSDMTHLLILPWNIASYLKEKLKPLKKEFL